MRPKSVFHLTPGRAAHAAPRAPLGGLIVGPLAVALFVAVATRPAPEIVEPAVPVPPALEQPAATAPH